MRPLNIKWCSCTPMCHWLRDITSSSNALASQRLIACNESWNIHLKHVRKHGNFIVHHKTICLSVMFQLSLAGIKSLRGNGIITRLSSLDWTSMRHEMWNGKDQLKSTVWQCSWDQRTTMHVSVKELIG